MRDSGIVTAAAADIVQRAILSRDTRTITAACRVAAMIAHGVLTGIELRAAKVARNYADAPRDIIRIGAAQEFPDIRCVDCEN